MEPFVRVTGVVAPLDRVNVDTDQIIPKQFLKRVEKTGYGEFLFFDWRYLADGSPNPEFVINYPRYEGAAILVSGRNFGCGSSREHAPWALGQYGFRTVIAPSFADIFYNNCFKNGLLPVVLDEASVATLTQRATEIVGYQATVDLEQCEVRDDLGLRASFSVDEFRRHCMLEGLDDIALTLRHAARITAFEANRPVWTQAIDHGR